MMIGVILQVVVYPGNQPLAQFVIGRIVTGVGNGINTSTIPTYQAECSKSSNRGLLICIEGGVVAIGTMVAYWIDYGASYGPDDLVWRFPIAFQCFFCISITVGMYFLPDSPRWLFLRGKYDEGERVIAALGGVEPSDKLVQVEKATILDSLRAYVPPFSSRLRYSDPLTVSSDIVRVLVASQLRSQLCSQAERLNICAVCFWAPLDNSCSRSVDAMQ